MELWQGNILHVSDIFWKNIFITSEFPPPITPLAEAQASAYLEGITVNVN